MICSSCLAPALGRGCSVSACSLGSDLQLSDSVARRASTTHPCLPGSPSPAWDDGRGLVGWDMLQIPDTALSQLNAQSRKQEKLSQHADVQCGISSPDQLCVFLKMFPGKKPKSLDHWSQEQGQTTQCCVSISSLSSSYMWGTLQIHGTKSLLHLALMHLFGTQMNCQYFWHSNEPLVLLTYTFV